jgi:hypothetical protein
VTTIKRKLFDNQHYYHLLTTLYLSNSWVVSPKLFRSCQYVLSWHTVVCHNDQSSSAVLYILKERQKDFYSLFVLSLRVKKWANRYDRVQCVYFNDTSKKYTIQRNWWEYKDFISSCGLVIWCVFNCFRLDDQLIVVACHYHVQTSSVEESLSTSMEYVPIGNSR